MVVWGGYNGSFLNSGASYRPAPLDDWQATNLTNAPSGRETATAVWTGSIMIVWGGYDGNGTTGDTNTGGVYDPNSDTWTATSTTGAPTGRYFQTGVWTGQELVIWGGYNNVVDFNNGGQYDPATDTWSALSLINAPTARERQTAVWANNRMIVWGGITGNLSTYFNTGGQWAQLSIYQKN